MLQLELSHYSDVYITVKGTITVQGQIIEIKNRPLLLEKILFISCISNINGVLTDNS